MGNNAFGPRHDIFPGVALVVGILFAIAGLAFARLGVVAVLSLLCLVAATAAFFLWHKKRPDPVAEPKATDVPTILFENTPSAGSEVSALRPRPGISHHLPRAPQPRPPVETNTDVQ